MGQFSSTAFDGDPYIDIMRALPEREVIWWVSKGLWLAEGCTFLEHFVRTYPDIMLHKCGHCNGAGTVICPGCRGYKLRPTIEGAGTFRLSDRSKIGRVLSQAGAQECQQCGGYCEWDAESEWEGKWNEWEKKLAYYDRSQGALFDEWYDDILGEGRVEEEMAPMVEPEPLKTDKSAEASVQRDIRRAPQRLQAMMRRYGGHPYVEDDLMAMDVVDPSKPLSETVRKMEANMNFLPPELNPTAFPELLLDPMSALTEHYRQIEMEDKITTNLEAALRDAPKSEPFAHTAGTVACPACAGTPWNYSIFPNVGKLTRSEVPFGMRTLQRMSQYWYQGDPRGPAEQPAQASSSGRLYGEVPRQPLRDAELERALALGAPRPGEGRKNFDRFIKEQHRLRAEGPRWFADFGTQMVAPPKEEDSEGTPTLLDSADPLSEDPMKALDWDVVTQRHYRSDYPLHNRAAVEAAMALDANQPARRLARQVRDLRLLDAAEDSETRAEVAQFVAARGSQRAEGPYDPRLFAAPRGGDTSEEAAADKRPRRGDKRRGRPMPASLTSGGGGRGSSGARG